MKNLKFVLIALIALFSLSSFAIEVKPIIETNLTEIVKNEKVFKIVFSSDYNLNQNSVDLVHKNYFLNSLIFYQDSEKIELAKKAVQSEIETKINSVAKAVVKCHTSYSSNSGSACVDVDGTLISVHWNCPGESPYTGCVRTYFAWVNSECKC